MSAKTKRFAERVKARMLEVRLRTHDAVLAAGGPTSPTMTKILSGKDDISDKTLEKLEVALRLEPGSAATSLANDTDLVPMSESVSPDTEDEDTLLYRRPDGVGVDEWRAIKARTRNLVEWEIEQALREP